MCVCVVANQLLRRDALCEVLHYLVLNIVSSLQTNYSSSLFFSSNSSANLRAFAFLRSCSTINSGEQLYSNNRHSAR